MNSSFCSIFVLLFFGTEALPIDPLEMTLYTSSLREFLTLKCGENGGLEALRKFAGEEDRVDGCLNVATDSMELLQTALSAKVAVDDLMDRYCTRVVALKECAHDAKELIEACFPESERTSIQFIVSVVEGMADFTCYNNGDCVIFFVADGGPDCMVDKKVQLKDCLEERFLDNSTDFVSPLSMNQTQICSNYDNFQRCAVKSLESCRDVTPANVIDALLTYIFKNTSCKEVKIE